MDGVELPGSRNIKKPIATETPTDITQIVERPRASQVFTQFSEENVPAQLSPNAEYYNPREAVESSGAGGFLSKVSDFFDDSPFGRILDNGLTAALNGGDVKDALLGGLTNEVVQGIQNPADDTIFGADVNLQVQPGQIFSGGWRPDSGSDGSENNDANNDG